MSTEFEKAIAEAKGLVVASGVSGSFENYSTGLLYIVNDQLGVQVTTEKIRSDGTFAAKVKIVKGGLALTTLDAMQLDEEICFNPTLKSVVKLANRLEVKLAGREFRASGSNPFNFNR